MGNAKTSFCGDRHYLHRYLQERLAEHEESSVIEHIGACETCQQTLEQLAAGEAVWNRLGEHLSFAAPDAGETREFDERERWLARLKDYLAPTDDPKMMGRLGSYEVCGLIGSGSTGIVLKALEPRLNRYVAIKVLSPSYSSLGASRKRFEREGRAVAAVANEHVVPIFAVDEHQGLPYIVMQYVPGGSLLQRIQREGPLDTCEVTRIGLQVALGLAAAHAQGIVHRDVKPANVLLENTVDRAMVTDFGLARVTDEATMTRSGTIAGTPQYMSPEQARGEPVDARTDLFSLGSLMYAACTGRPPFRAETVYGVINRVCEAEPRPIRDLNPAIDKWLLSFIDRLMSKRPAERFETAEQVATILSGELAHLQNPAAVPKPPRDWVVRKPRAARTRTSRGPLIASGLFALLLLSGLTAFMFGPFDLSMLAAAPGSKRAKAKQPALPAAAPEAPEAPVATSPESPAAPPVASAIATSPSPSAAPEAPSVPTATSPAAPRALETPRDPVVGQTSVVVSQTSRAVADITEREIQIDLQVGDIQIFPGGNADTVRIVSESSARVLAAPSTPGVAVPISHAEFVSLDIKSGVLVVSSAGDYVPDQHRKESVSLLVPDDFQLELATQKGDISVGTLTKQVPGGARGEEGGTMFLPGNFRGDVRAKSTDGCIELAMIDGDVHARTLRGDIDINAGCTGAVDLMATNGDVRFANLIKTGRVRTSGGDVWVGKNEGEVYVQTSGGDIEVREIAGPLGAYTSDGDIFVTLTESPDTGAQFGAAAGDVTVEFLEDVGLNFEFTGKLKAPFIPAAVDLGSKTSGSLSFNDGSPTIEATSTTGTVTLAYLEPDDDGLGGSGPRHLGGSGLGGSGGPGSTVYVSEIAKAKTSGPPRAGALATIEFADEEVMDGYTLYLPVSFDSHEGKYPVIVYLQGGYGVGGEVGAINNWGLTRLVRDESDLSSERNQLLLDSFIVVSPHIQRGDYHDEADIVDRILGDVMADYRGDPERVYVTGVSRGGHGSWGLAAKLPGTFAAIAPMGGNPRDMDDFAKLDGVAIWIGHNADDGIVDYGPVEAAMSQIERRADRSFRRASNMQLLAENDDYLDDALIQTSSPGGSHDSWTDVYTSAEFYKWLLRQKRGS